MQITLTLPDELARQIQVLPDRERFVRETLESALRRRVAGNPLSKWAKIARRIEEHSPGLGDYTESWKQDLREVREDLVFKDLP